MKVVSLLNPDITQLTWWFDKFEKIGYPFTIWRKEWKESFVSRFLWLCNSCSEPNRLELNMSGYHKFHKHDCKLTPFITRCLIMLSSPTNAPLKINKILDVSIWYNSWVAVENYFRMQQKQGNAKTYVPNLRSLIVDLQKPPQEQDQELR